LQLDSSVSPPDADTIPISAETGIEMHYNTKLATRRRLKFPNKEKT
jgi:hypothetical protein